MNNVQNSKLGEFFGKLYSFNNSLKLYHWHVTGEGSYARHIAIDQALTDLGDAMDRIVETSYAMYGDIAIVIPETGLPEDIVEHANNFFQFIDKQREMFPESFSGAILDDYQEAIQQMVYRLKRLE